MNDINFERGSTASVVAALLGFADASGDAAAGFQNKYRELSRRGAFDGARNIGDVLKVYCLAVAEGKVYQVAVEQ